MTYSDSRMVLGTTESVCPDCLKTVSAIRYAEGDTVYLEKSCPEHGTVSTPIWRGLKSYFLWDKAPRNQSQILNPATSVDKGCPHDCGICSDHQQQSCCVLLEVTSRCNIACPFCFASAEREGKDVSMHTINKWLDTLMERAGGRVHIQLSGGEPTVRDDLPEIIALVRSKGFSFVQLNTNGLRLSKDPNYVRALADAGLDCVFLQFDGVSDTVHKAMRGAKLARIKEDAIAACEKAHIGVVLVPTLVPGVNTDQIGVIVDYAKAHMPTVRAVHFQPVSYFGRTPEPPRPETRFTLPEVMDALISHEKGRISLYDFHPGSAENPFCSFSGRFVVEEDGRLVPDQVAQSSCCSAGEDTGGAASQSCGCGVPGEDLLVRPPETEIEHEQEGCRCSSGNEPEPAKSSCCPGPDAQKEAVPGADVARARRYVADQWSCAGEEDDTDDPSFVAFDAVLKRRARTLGLSAMVFQDAWTLDLERLRQCYIHVMMPDQKAVPFCAFNLTDREGRSLYRKEEGC
ncbi:radical SAM (seleno)protein TrsS [Cohaesibacter marisflavi]|uniref:radical SAM (seleno)protein TrsS n=1 Tax=Cohaesibacter marisflavi TaxID=655353 RepID=UPI0029C688BB|nr:radical SAM (seleno)protein TrsS [Cohaesibacter marisflavi]